MSLPELIIDRVDPSTWCLWCACIRMRCSNYRAYVFIFHSLFPFNLLVHLDLHVVAVCFFPPLPCPKMIFFMSPALIKRGSRCKLKVGQNISRPVCTQTLLPPYPWCNHTGFWTSESRLWMSFPPGDNVPGSVRLGVADPAQNLLGERAQALSTTVTDNIDTETIKA